MDGVMAGKGVDDLLGLSEALFRQLQPGSQGVWLTLHLTVPQLKVLHVLVSSGPQIPSSLAEVLRVSPATVTGLCDGLVERGLAVRESNPEDRRSNRVVATQKGRHIVADLGAIRQEQWVRILGKLSEEERELVGDAFRALLRAAQSAAGVEVNG